MCCIWVFIKFNSNSKKIMLHQDNLVALKMSIQNFCCSRCLNTDFFYVKGSNYLSHNTGSFIKLNWLQIYKGVTRSKDRTHAKVRLLTTTLQ